LQFPDNLLKYSNKIVNYLNTSYNTEYFILADTSYGNCCVDKVAASHVDSDCLIHFGHSCLSGVEDIPVIYSFGKSKLNVEDCVETIVSQLKQKGIQQNIVDGIVPLSQNVTEEKNNRNDLELSYKDRKLLRISGRYYSTDNINYDLLNNQNNESTVLFYIGEESIELTNLLLNVQNKIKLYRYDPIKQQSFLDGVTVNRQLMRRYVQVQKAKDSTTFGICVGTLGIENSMEMIEKVENLIKSKGGKSYTFVMGKLNVAKLANFMEIDIFILIACPENSLIDSKEFFKPIVTPFELELALDSRLEWNGTYSTEFEAIFNSKEKNEETKEDENGDGDENINDEDEDKPHFSLITGKFVAPRRHINIAMDNETNSSSLTTVNSERQISQMMGSTAGEYLANRSFRGLEMNLENNKVEKATEGKMGIAKGYSNEKEL
ncbi:diphthamide biosynthesis protein, partial [Neoconidiobolus thromboides FSU 785]